MLHEMKPAFGRYPNSGHGLKTSISMLSAPPFAHVKDSYQDRNVPRCSVLEGPTVTSEIYHGASPGDEGLDNHGKSSSMVGINVTTNIDCVSSTLPPRS